MIHSFLQKLKRAGQACLNLLFHEQPEDFPHANWVVRVLLAGLFVAGLLHWGIFLDWFNNHFDIQDWHIHVGPYLDFLKQAIRSGQCPLQADSPYMIPGQYLARQNRPFSPQILLLYFLDPSAYVVVNVWIFYSLGFIGLLLIRRRYRLSFISFLVLYLLFNFNGQIIARMGVGHFEWVAYLLLPFYVLLVLKMLEGEKTGWKWLFSMALLMLAITLQGAAHIFIYCMTFLLLISLFHPRYFLTAIKAIVLSALVCMIRILPPMLQYAGGTGLQYLGGFTSLLELIGSFVVLYVPRGYWEEEYYVGVIGFAFLFYFGMIRSWMKDDRYRPLFLPMLIMAFFSIGSIYQVLFNLPIPFLDSQRAPTRFLIVPLAFLVILASLQFQTLIKSWEKAHHDEKMMVLFAAALMAYDLYYHSRVWSLDNYGDSKRATDVITVAVSSYVDPRYLTTLILGTVCTVVTLIILGILAYRERKEKMDRDMTAVDSNSDLPSETRSNRTEQ